MPSLTSIAVGSLAFGGIFLFGGVLLIVRAIRRARREDVATGNHVRGGGR
jgi:hypothetical protein